MPWTDGSLLFERCTGCGACARACPEGIVVQGRGGHPQVVFNAACTFCGACAEACGEDAFDLARDPPWVARAAVREGCLEHEGVACRACEDVCPQAAIRARPRLGGRVEIEVAADECTGCGACVPVCPTRAIEVAANGPASR
jgi:ferredoxin-type protein NapF